MRPLRVLCLLLAVVATAVTVHRYNQMAEAASRAHARLVAAEGALSRERGALQAERAQLEEERKLRAEERKLCAAALPSREAVREAVRQLLSDATATAAASSIPLQQVVQSSAASTQSASVKAQAELIRAEMREASSQEEPGWCNCPPLPDLGLLCRALVPPLNNQSAAWADQASAAREEAAALREVVADSQLRAQAASEALLEANAIGATQSRQAEAAMTELTSCKAKLAHPKEPNADDCAPMVRLAQQLLARAVGSHVEQLKANLSECERTRVPRPREGQ